MRFPTPTAPKATAGLLVVMALALGQWLHEHLPEPQDSARPFEVAVTASDTAVMRSGDLDVVSVDGATSVLPARGYGDPMISPGLFVVVDFTFTPRDESSAITYAALRDNLGRVLPFFTSSVRSVVSCPARLVGRPTQCLAVVEADPETLPGAALALAPDGTDERFDSMAVVDLGIDEADLSRWLEADPISLPEPGELASTTAAGGAA